MSDFRIVGGNKLFGSIEVESAKNAILPILAGSILCGNIVTIKNCTYYKDVLSMIDILKYMGASVKMDGQDLTLDCNKINKFDIPETLSNKLRASIFFMGPLLSKFKRAKVAYPGGCSIGMRPIDIHLGGLKSLGARVVECHGFVEVFGDQMKCGNVHMPFPSVGATENLIMASLFLEGMTTLYGVAKEPEIVDLCNFLNKMGAKIQGHGSDVIVIEGVSLLGGGDYAPIPDRIITGTYMMLPLMCGGELEIDRANHNHVLPLINILENNTCKVYVEDDRIVVSSNGKLNGFGRVETLPYPHFPTDLQQPLASLSSVCSGSTIIVENMFENRFEYVGGLVKMGAKMSVGGRILVIDGVSELSGATVNAGDLRGGMALVMAGLNANGYSTVKNAEIIDRGYYKIEQKLKMLGANISRIET